MATTYGLTRQTMDTYREAVRHGYNYTLAMIKLKALYEHNREQYKYDTIHRLYVQLNSPVLSEGLPQGS